MGPKATPSEIQATLPVLLENQRKIMSMIESIDNKLTNLNLNLVGKSGTEPIRDEKPQDSDLTNHLEEIAGRQEASFRSIDHALEMINQIGTKLFG
jgi:hypothetical protein